MGFIKDSLNVKIFLLVILVVVAMVSLLIVFRNNFEAINSKYNNKVLELNSTFENLTGTQKQLNKTISDLELKNIKEEDLKTKYTELDKQKTDLEKEIDRLNSVIADKDSKITTLNFKIADLQIEVNSLTKKVSNLQKRVDCFQNGGTGC